MSANATWRLIAAAGFVLLTLEVITLLPVRARLLLPAYALCFGVVIWARRRLLVSGRFARPLLVGFAVSLLPVGVGLFLGHEDPTMVFVEDVLPTLVGWTVLLVLLPLAADAPPAGTVTERSPGRVAVIALLFVAFGALALAHQLAVGKYALISDEVVMLTQSRWMEFPRVAMPMAPDLAPFFVTRKVDYLNGQLYGMYPQVAPP